MPLPSVYIKPFSIVAFGFLISFDMYAIAVILVAKGQGLIEVNIPTRNAVKIGMLYESIRLFIKSIFRKFY